MSEQALLELLRPRRSSRTEPAQGSATDVDGDPVADDLAISVEHDEWSSGCDDLYAPHDLTALEAGRLPREGILRLAQHVARCRTCKIAVATIVAEASRAESTGTHAAPKQDDRQLQ